MKREEGGAMRIIKVSLFPLKSSLKTEVGEILMRYEGRGWCNDDLGVALLPLESSLKTQALKIFMR